MTGIYGRVLLIPVNSTIAIKPSLKEKHRELLISAS